MTSQIVIKLNKKKFKPILDFVKKGALSKSYSELAGLCVWYCHNCLTKKVPELGNKTKAEFIAENMGMSPEERILATVKEYNDFIKGKKKK